MPPQREGNEGKREKMEERCERPAAAGSFRMDSVACACSLMVETWVGDG